MSSDYNSKILGKIDEELADKWHQPEFKNNSILLFSGIDKHAKNHFPEFTLGEKSKNYTMKHLRDVIKNPEYISYSVKNNGFVFYKELLEYVAVTIKPTNDYPDVFCVSTIYPTSKNKVQIKKNEEKKIIKKIDEQKKNLEMQKEKDLIEKYTHKENN